MDLEPTTTLDEFDKRAIAFYNTQLRDRLEAEHLGEAVAIHMATGEYIVGRDHREAARAMRARHGRDGQIVTFTIGPPTAADRYLTHRIAVGERKW